MKATIVLGIATLPLFACGPSIHVSTIRVRPPLAPASEVAVYSVRVPECDFGEVGLLTIRESPKAYGDGLLPAMKAAALEMGGNLLLRLQPVPKTQKSPRGLTATVAYSADAACFQSIPGLAH